MRLLALAPFVLGGCVISNEPVVHTIFVASEMTEVDLLADGEWLQPHPRTAGGPPRTYGVRKVFPSWLVLPEHPALLETRDASGRVLGQIRVDRGTCLEVCRMADCDDIGGLVEERIEVVVDLSGRIRLTGDVTCFGRYGTIGATP
jgi:hypothetical protein